MSSGKFNRNAAKRIYNINSLNHPVIMDLFTQQELKNIPHSNLYTSTNSANKPEPNTNHLVDDKNSPLTITAKSLISQNILARSNNRNNTKLSHEMDKNIKEIKLILE